MLQKALQDIKAKAVLRSRYDNFIGGNIGELDTKSGDDPQRPVVEKHRPIFSEKHAERGSHFAARPAGWGRRKIWSTTFAAFRSPNCARISRSCRRKSYCSTRASLTTYGTVGQTLRTRQCAR
ncbi:MAG: hypothetical protein B7X10_06840, partial [Burkholderiales bacterium 21-58-4]